jgi:hypothetical protein
MGFLTEILLLDNVFQYSREAGAGLLDCCPLPPVNGAKMAKI